MEELTDVYRGYRDKRRREQEVRRARRRVADQAASQHGLITTWQLRLLGFDADVVTRWVAEGRLHRVYRGVYLVGHPALTAAGRLLAAVLACGPGALLSHLSAAVLHRLLDRDPIVIDVTVPRARRRRDGIRVHAPVQPWAAADASAVDAIPVTSAPRTFVDLASMVGEARLTEALRAGQRLQLIEPLALLPALAPCEKHRGRHGIALARKVLRAYVPAPGRVRSGLEQEYWEICATHGSPLPLVNVPIAGYEADFVWPELALIIETDGERWHRTDVDRVRDAERDTAHRALGYEVVRIGEREIGNRARDLARHRRILERAEAGLGDRLLRL